MTRLLFILVLTTSALWGCDGPKVRPLIADYEVLDTPRPVELYKAGAAWQHGIGPGDAATTKVTTGDGAEVMSSARQAAVTRGLNIAITDWMKANASSAGTFSAAVAAKGLSQAAVSDPYDIQFNGLVLWETLSVDKFVLRESATSRAGVDVTADVSKILEELNKQLKGKAELKIQSTEADGTVISSNKPLVLAIRVMRCEYASRGAERKPLDLTQRKVGLSQEGPGGFRVTVVGRDPLMRTARLEIANPSAVRFRGAVLDFTGGNAAEVPTKQFVGQVGDYTWSTLSLIWAEDLAACALEANNQTITLSPAHSGLSTH